MKQNQNGFHHLGLLLVLVVGLIGLIGWRVYEKTSGKTGSTQASKVRLSPLVSKNPSCSQTGRVILPQAPVDADAMAALWPLGRAANDHISPADHQYLIGNDKTKSEGTPVRSPGDGVIFGITTADNGVLLGYPSRLQYTVAIAFSCNQAITLAFMDSVTPEFKKYVYKGNTAPEAINVPIKAGQIVGTMKDGMDVWLIDSGSELSGFIDKNDYPHEPWKFYAHSVADYLAQPHKNEYNAKSVRKVPPYGGKIDYDQPGKLIGNWFKQGALPNYMNQPQFWHQELSLFYDYIDPSTIRVMIGSLADGRPGNFGFNVVGNTPDPAKISPLSGLVKYSLVTYNYADEAGRLLDNFDHMYGDHTYHIVNDSQPWGVALFQMTAERQLKAEFFASKTADQVSGFTERAQIYER